MRIIDARTGHEVPYPPNGYRLPSDGRLIVGMRICGPWWWPTDAGLLLEDGTEVPLALRFLHPGSLMG